MKLFKTADGEEDVWPNEFSNLTRDFKAEMLKLEPKLSFKYQSFEQNVALAEFLEVYYESWCFAYMSFFKTSGINVGMKHFAWEDPECCPERVVRFLVDVVLL